MDLRCLLLMREIAPPFRLEKLELQRREERFECGEQVGAFRPEDAGECLVDCTILGEAGHEHVDEARRETGRVRKYGRVREDLEDGGCDHPVREAAALQILAQVGRDLGGGVQRLGTDLGDLAPRRFVAQASAQELGGAHDGLLEQQRYRRGRSQQPSVSSLSEPPVERLCRAQPRPMRVANRHPDPTPTWGLRHPLRGGRSLAPCSRRAGPGRTSSQRRWVARQSKGFASSDAAIGARSAAAFVVADGSSGSTLT